MSSFTQNEMSNKMSEKIINWDKFIQNIEFSIFQQIRKNLGITKTGNIRNLIRCVKDEEELKKRILQINGTYDLDLDYEQLTNESKHLLKYVEQEPIQEQEIEPLPVWTLQDFWNYKENKEYIIKGIIKPKIIEMVYAPSGSYKSIYSLYQAVCIATGKKFLNKFQTKQAPVLLICAENDEEQNKERIMSIRRGLKSRKRKIPLYVLNRRDRGDILDEEFKQRVKKTIEKYKIKVIYYDTINPLTPEIDDNKVRDVNSVFDNFLYEINEEYKCFQSFLHHTDKNEKGAIGSMKWKANSDNVLRIKREGISNQFEVYNEKNKFGENEVLIIEVKEVKKKKMFWKTELILKGTKQADVYSKKKKKTKITQEEYFMIKLNEHIEDKSMNRKDIYSIIKANTKFFKVDKHGKNSTLERAIKKWRENENKD